MRLGLQLARRAAPTPRGTAIAGLLLATLGLGASVIPPLLGGLAPGWGPGGMAATLSRILAALAALLAGALCLGVGAQQPGAQGAGAQQAGAQQAGARKSADEVAAVETSAALVAALRTAFQELRGLLATERGELAAFREHCAGATHEAMIVGARLAGVALDAETRLAAGVARAEQGLRQIDPARVFPAGAGPARDAAVADNAVLTFRAALADAADQMAALGDTAVALRRDVIALDTAGREIATAGAAAVSRAGEAVTRTETALARLPAAADTVAAAAAAAGRALTEGSATLRATGEDVARAGGATATAIAATLDAAAARLAAAGEQAGGAHREGAARAAATLAGATAALTDTAAKLAEGAETLTNTLVESNEQLARRTDAIAGFAETLAHGAETLARGGNSLEEAGQRIVGAAEQARAATEAAALRLDRLDVLGPRLENILATPPAIEPREAALAAAVADLSGLSAEIGEHMRRLAAALAQHEDAARAAASQEPSSPDQELPDRELPYRELPSRGSPFWAAGRADAALPALAATVHHLDGVTCQTETLLRETEALAEAVLAGRAPGLSPLLAERAPSLLAGVETTIRRLRSVATALTLASDAPAGTGAATAPRGHRVA